MQMRPGSVALPWSPKEAGRELPALGGSVPISSGLLSPYSQQGAVVSSPISRPYGFHRYSEVEALRPAAGAGIPQREELCGALTC